MIKSQTANENTTQQTQDRNSVLKTMIKYGMCITRHPHNVINHFQQLA